MEEKLKVLVDIDMGQLACTISRAVLAGREIGRVLATLRRWSWGTTRTSRGGCRSSTATRRPASPITRPSRTHTLVRGRHARGGPKFPSRRADAPRSIHCYHIYPPSAQAVTHGRRRWSSWRPARRVQRLRWMKEAGRRGGRRRGLQRGLQRSCRRRSPRAPRTLRRPCSRRWEGGVAVQGA